MADRLCLSNKLLVVVVTNCGLSQSENIVFGQRIKILITRSVRFKPYNFIYFIIVAIPRFLVIYAIF